MGTPAAVKPPVALPSVQEFSIRVPKNSNKRHNVMRFNATLKVDFSEWTQVKMERENNMKEYKGIDEDMPKFGAGSEFGRDAREEARRKKFGITSRKYKPDDQPWILKSGGRTGKKFKGTREGGVSENAAYYVFTHAPDGAIEAFPLHEWYNFQPIQRYKALSAEEAEQEFSRRNQVMNYFSLMMRKRLRNEEDGEDGEDGVELAEGGRKGAKKPAKKEKELKISEMDEWMESDDDDDSNSEAEKEKKPSDDETDVKNKKNGKHALAKKKKKKVSDDEAFEESDDGDEEGKECDYISDSSDAESEGEQHSTVKSVAEEDALRKLLASDEEEEDEDQAEKREDETSDEDDENKEKNDKEKDKLGKDQDRKNDKKKKKKTSKKKESRKTSPTKDSSSDFSSDSASEPESTTKEKDNRKSNSAHSSRSATPTPGTPAGGGGGGCGGTSATDQLKRKQSSSPDLSHSKKLKLDNFNLVPSTSYIPGTSESGITEDAVRRYLMRKPMTTTELLQKFKSKKTGLTSEQLVNVMTQILKRINPMKQTFKNKMYLSIKATM